MGRTSGVLWLVAAVTAGGGQLLPGSPPVMGWEFGGIEALVIVYSIACLTGVVPWGRIPMIGHALATAALLPLIGLVVWATGGSDSYAQPLALFPLLYIAFFFPLRYAAPLVFELIVVYATPLVYESDPTAHAFPARSLSFGVAAGIMTVVVRGLKNRLVEAERRQREMARTDALTGLANRRGFDDTLARDLGEGCALLVLDLDDFKLVNDSLGHHAGDRLLRLVGEGCAHAVRAGDTVARIGGDEFAVIAPRAGEAVAERLAEAVELAAMEAGSRVTVGWAVQAGGGYAEEDLLRAAYRGLNEGKRRRRTSRPLVATTA